MSNRTYPRLGIDGSGFVNMRKTCMFCGKHNNNCVCIEWDYFRGNDDVVNVCKDCRKLNDITKIIAKKLELQAKGLPHAHDTT